jgi:hypothetical protein
MSVAIKWKKAILNKDFKTLISLSLPEDSIWLEQQLNDKSSELYRIIYDDQWNHQKGKRSIYEILGNAIKLEIVMVKCGGYYWESIGYTTAVYFFDKKKLSSAFPLAIKDYKLVGKDIWLLWVIRDWGQWFINFNFLDEGEIGRKRECPLFSLSAAVTPSLALSPSLPCVLGAPL